MENRWSFRKPVEMDVDVYFGSQPPATGRTRDVGYGGMFIEAPDVSIPLRRRVEVVVKLPFEGKPEYRFHASVVHSTGKGLGVSFRQFDLSDVRVLQRML